MLDVTALEGDGAHGTPVEVGGLMVVGCVGCLASDDDGFQ